MATKLDIDAELLNEALRVSGQGTVREAVTLALTEFVQRRKQGRVLELFGTLEWSPFFHHKKERERA